MSADNDGSADSSDAKRLQSELTATREKLSQLTDRQQRLADLLKCTPDRIEHDLRNVLNELQLLRTIFENEEKKS